MGLRAPPAGSPGAVHDQVRDPVGERVGLARARAGDDQQRAGDVRAPAGHAVLDGAALLRIEAFEGARCRHRLGPDRGSWIGPRPDHDSFAGAKHACAQQKKRRRI